MNSLGNILELEGIGFSYRQRESFFRHSSFVALQDVSFSVATGETLGIIGRNGCGKSTLLRVIAGIFEPERGTIRRRCSKVSLLSLALGFDPELDGVANAIISGMFLGATRAEVVSELDAIIGFADLGEFIHKPVKTYSTGMRARLGFSVALKMQADLLLIDEVMGVGDTQFRQKAEKVMAARINSTQTVIIVSHSLPQLNTLCDRIVWMDKGRVKKIGEPQALVKQYSELWSQN